MTVAKKVNDYLKAGADIDSDIVEHGDRMETWLSKLLTQIRGSPVICGTDRGSRHTDLSPASVTHVRCTMLRDRKYR